MAISEEARHQLYRKLDDVLTEPHATTLMEHLPPVGWADVATKHDLDGLRRRFDEVDRRFDDLEERLGGRVTQAVDQLRAEMYKNQRDLILAAVGANAVLAGVVIAVVQLL